MSILNNAVHDADETLRLVEMLCPRFEFSIGPAWSETNGKDASLNKSNKCGHVLWDQYWHGPLAPMRLRLEATASGLKPPLLVEPTVEFEMSMQAPVDRLVAMRQRPSHGQHAATQQKNRQRCITPFPSQEPRQPRRSRRSRRALAPFETGLAPTPPEWQYERADKLEHMQMRVRSLHI